MTEVDGIPNLLRGIAGRLENSADGLSKDFLLEVADKVESLEIVARTAAYLVWYVPRKHKDAKLSLVPRCIAEELVEVLNEAGHYGKDGGVAELRKV